ncbi:uncharacterized protein [Henckelia pumila]|uniref:uncharacterized protein n=1 Tax=Henckelia pumila TaxID=405737 RepID=UPI003C6E61AE
MVENEPPHINGGDRDADAPPAYRSMMDCALPSIEDARPSIIRPNVVANQYDIKSAIIQMIQNSVQFGGTTIGNPKAQIANFLDICDNFKHQGVCDEVICLRLFHFSLRDKAKEWINNLPPGSITTRENLAKAFLTKYFPSSKSMKLRTEITTFAQGVQESLYEAWERYKDLLRRFPHHKLFDWFSVQYFYYGLLHDNCTMLDTTTGGNLLCKSPEDGHELFEEMASSIYHPQFERNTLRKSVGIHQVYTFTSMAAQLEAMNNKIDSLSVGNFAMRIQEVFCYTCGGEHFTKDFQIGNPFYVPDGAPMNHVGSQNRPRNDPCSNTYNPGWRQHPSCSWGGQNNLPYRNQNNGKQPQEEKSILEQISKVHIIH